MISLRGFCLAAILAALLVPFGSAGAQVASPGPSPRPSVSPAASATLPAALRAILGAGAAAVAAPQPYAQFLRGATVEHGLIDLIRKDEDLYFDLGPEQFEKTYIIAPSLASGLGAGTFAGRLYSPPILVQFKRLGKRILWVTPNTDFGARDGSATSRSLAISTADSIIASSPIVAEDEQRNRVAIAPSPLFLSDYLKIGGELSQAAGGTAAPGGGLVLILGGARGGFSLDASRSYYLATKALPENDEISVNLTFSGSGNLQTVPDTRGTPIKVHYSIVEEPKSDTYVPRPADDRIGYFVETQKRFGDDAERTPFVRYIDRWDLSRGPIVFTLTNEIPPQYRGAIRRGILEWNHAFAKIGYPNAIRVDDPPADPAFDPDDIRYNTVRWITQDRPSFVAATPEVSDPLTGRIIHAVITVDGESLRSLRRGFVDSVLPVRTPVNALSPYAQAFDPAAASRPIVAIAPACLQAACDGDEVGRNDAALGMLAIREGVGAARMNAAQTDKYVDAYVASVITHETGHALGLRHNFASSGLYSLAELNDPAFTAKHGLVSSVMGYAPVNLAPPGKPQGAYFQTHLGPYDYWAIEYGYKPIPGARTPAGEAAALRRIADRSSERDLAFETDEDAGGAWAVDPRVAPYVLSSDPIAWHRERFEIDDALFAKLDRRFPSDDRSYYDERLAFFTTLGDYANSAIRATRWVGGVFVSRAHRGQAGGKPPFSPVPLRDQRRAFDLIDRYVFSAQALRFPSRLVERLGPDRFHGWGDQGLGARPDFPLTGFVGNLQDVVIYSIFSPANLARINDQSILAPGKTMSLQDLFEWSRLSIYDDVAAGNPIQPLHRELQRRFTDLLLQVALLPSFAIDQLQIPYETQALARYELRRVAATVRSGLQSRRLDVGTRAHLEELSARIARGLDAQNVRSI